MRINREVPNNNSLLLSSAAAAVTVAAPTTSRFTSRRKREVNPSSFAPFLSSDPRDSNLWLKHDGIGPRYGSPGYGEEALGWRDTLPVGYTASQLREEMADACVEVDQPTSHAKPSSRLYATTFTAPGRGQKPRMQVSVRPPKPEPVQNQAEEYDYYCKRVGPGDAPATVVTAFPGIRQIPADMPEIRAAALKQAREILDSREATINEEAALKFKHLDEARDAWLKRTTDTNTATRYVSQHYFPGIASISESRDLALKLIEVERRRLDDIQAEFVEQGMSLNSDKPTKVSDALSRVRRFLCLPEGVL